MNEVFAVGGLGRTLKAKVIQWPRNRKEHGWLLKSQCESSGWGKLKIVVIYLKKKIIDLNLY